MKLYGNMILMATICIVIFWIVMALRPAQAAPFNDWTGCKVEPSAYVTVASDEELFEYCERDFDLELSESGYNRPALGRVCKFNKLEDLPGPENPRLAHAT